MSPYYYQARKKKKGLQKGLAILSLFVSASVIFVCFLFPSLTGKFGLSLHLALMNFAGFAAILIPLYLFWLGIQLLDKEKKSGVGVKSFFILLLFSFLSALFSIFHTAPSLGGKIQQSSFGKGGVLGDWLSLFLIEQFGLFFAVAIILGGCFFSGAWFFGFSPLYLLLSLKEKIVQDIADWRAERQESLERAQLAKKLEEIIPTKKELQTTNPAPQPSLLDASESKTNFKKTTSSLAETSERTKSEEPQKKESKSSPDLSSSLLSDKKIALTKVADGQSPYAGYLLPELNLLELPEAANPFLNKEELYKNGTLLEQTLEQFHVKAKVIEIHPGPVITRYDLSPAPGVRVQAIESLVHDIALAMKAQSLRVIAPIPGKAAVGIEISNPHPATVYLGEILGSRQFLETSQPLSIALGKTTEGEPFVTDLVSMPHLLIAGATGSGKSVCIHSLILSLLFRHKPDILKLLLIDPKRLELPVYNGLPHLYNPASSPEEVKVLTEPKEVVMVLKKLILEMEMRYKEFARVGVRNIESYNEKKTKEGHASCPYIVVIIDELADLMVIVGREIEDSIQRLAQMARAVGIHLVLATQRPSVDVITGVIKANLPSRIAFQVLSKTDSRVILDTQGAEDLLGRGDMLFLATGAPRPIRLQGAYVSESDVNRVLKFIKEQKFLPSYEVLPEESEDESIVDSQENQRLLLRAAKVVRDSEKVSGDLLRADKEIGSKYDLALTLLRKKGLIEKPKDTNRWKIHFDRLAEFLAEAEKD